MIKEADFIVVGAGSAGCVLAAELSANPKHSVVLIEAGPMDSSFFLEMPRGIGKILAPGNPHVWAYDVTKGGGRGTETWLKGRAIGGSSSINGMVYARGFASDYNRWAQDLGCDGWGWNDMLPHLMAHEDHEFGATDERAVGGAIHVTGHPADSSGDNPKGLCEAFLNASEQAGTPRVSDTNLASTETGGIGYQPRNIYKGKRQSASKVFLHPVMARKNLTVLHSTDVLRIVFEGKKATGVEVWDASGTNSIACHLEVILSAGAIESPKLLQLSGVGPADRLTSLGVDVVHDAPQVGQNLREHFYIQHKYRVTKGSLNGDFQGPKLLWNMLRYLVNRNGPMANAAQEMVGYIKTREGLSRPDCQLGAGLYTLQNTPAGPVLDKQPGFTIGGYHMHPQSQGELMIKSNDAREMPNILVNYLQHEEDQAASIAMVRYIRKIAEQPALAPYLVSEMEPGLDINDDAAILEAYHQLGGTAFHVSGTCRMGSDEQSVVDPQTRVRGIEGLRVVDTSIFPELPSGNTNAPTMAAGRNAAQMIKRDHP